MLRGQRLRRGQEHALQARLGGADQAVQGDDRLARAHVALQQAPHGDVAAQVALELVQRLELMRGQLEREPVEERVRELAGLRQRRRVHALLLFLLVQQQAGLHEQQFLEHEPLARRARLAERPRQVHGRDRVGAAGQTLPDQQLRRQRVRQPAHHRSDRVHERPQELGRHLFTGRVDGDDALGVHAFPVFLVEDLVPLDDERLTAALRPERPAETEAHALLKHLRQVALVEPDGLDRAGVVAQQDLDDVDPATGCALGAHAHDLAADGGLFPDLEVADPLAVAEVLVAAREVLDQVADGLQAEPGETARHGRGDVLEVGERAVERGWVEGEAGDRRPLVVPTAAEALRKRLSGHSTIIANAAVPGPMWVPTTAATWPWKV